MPSIAVSRRTLLAFAVTVAARPRLTLAAIAIEGDWVGEDDKRRVVRLTILSGKVVFFCATSDNKPCGLDRAAGADPASNVRPRRVGRRYRLRRRTRQSASQWRLAARRHLGFARRNCVLR
jgi:hypothetical protein